MTRIALVLILAGCAALLPAPGRKMTQAPADTPFCKGGPQTVGPRDGGPNVEVPGIEDCTTLMRYYGALSGQTAWSGVIDFQLIVDADGGVTDVCVEGGNFGNVPEYVSCVASKARQHRGLPPGRCYWRLKYIYD